MSLLKMLDIMGPSPDPCGIPFNNVLRRVSYTYCKCPKEIGATTNIR